MKKKLVCYFALFFFFFFFGFVFYLTHNDSLCCKHCCLDVSAKSPQMRPESDQIVSSYHQLTNTATDTEMDIVRSSCLM